MVARVRNKATGILGVFFSACEAYENTFLKDGTKKKNNGQRKQKKWKLKEQQKDMKGRECYTTKEQRKSEFFLYFLRLCFVCVNRNFIYFSQKKNKLSNGIGFQSSSCKKDHNCGVRAKLVSPLLFFNFFFFSFWRVCWDTTLDSVYWAAESPPIKFIFFFGGVNFVFAAKRKMTTKKKKKQKDNQSKKNKQGGKEQTAKKKKSN